MRCLMCGKELGYGSLRDILIGEDPLCSSCRDQWQRKHLSFRINGIPAESSYIYNDAFSSVLIQYKECMDEALAPVFLAEVKKELKRKYKGYTLLLMPSSHTKRKERGFSHLALMYRQLGLEMMEPFEKTEEDVQKGRSALEREEMAMHIRLKSDIRLPKRILLADDTITTGATIRGALRALGNYDGKVRIYAVSANRSYSLNFTEKVCEKRMGFDRRR